MAVAVGVVAAGAVIAFLLVKGNTDPSADPRASGAEPPGATPRPVVPRYRDDDDAAITKEATARVQASADAGRLSDEERKEALAETKELVRREWSVLNQTVALGRERGESDDVILGVSASVKTMEDRVAWTWSFDKLPVKALYERAHRKETPDATPALDSPRLPFNPYARSRAGDWEALLVTSTRSESGRRTVRKAVMTFRITKVTDGEVFVVQELRGEGIEARPGEPQPRPKKEGLTVAELLGGPGESGDGKLSEVKFDEVTKSIGGKSFACARLSFTSTRVSPSKIVGDTVFVHKTVLWLSSDLGHAGLGGLSGENTYRGGGQPTTEESTEGVVVGYGNGDTVEWGKRPEEVE